MKENKILKIILVQFVFVLIFSNLNIKEVNAEETQTESYCISEGVLVNTGNNNGYSGNDKITSDDIHYGWTVGKFYISGFTRKTSENDTNVFLKNVGDEVKLTFKLEQNIKKLNNDTSLSIVSDNKGYDEYFGTPQTNFGKGALIIKQTNYKNESKQNIYSNYLKATAKKSANVTVELCSEGDYEVALDYEIKNDRFKVLENSIFPKYTNYRIFFKFSVRNSNCMVFPFDVKTKSELNNSSITPNGFYLDFAKSKYLEINVKRSILNKQQDDIEEDTRFNRAAKDGEKYTEEGIYTLTIKNVYTNTQEEKTIYVGDNKLLKAHVATNLSIKKINEMISEGAKIDDDGNIKLNGVEYSTNNTVPKEKTVSSNIASFIDDYFIYISTILLLIVLITAFVIYKKFKRGLNKYQNNETDKNRKRGAKSLDIDSEEEK